MENTTFQSVLEQVVLAQNPELFIYASKLNKGMIDSPKYVIVRVYKDSSLFPQPPRGFKFKNPGSAAYVRASVIKHNMISNQLLLEDGTWVLNQDQLSSESDWIRDIEPIEESKPLLPGEDIF